MEQLYSILNYGFPLQRHTTPQRLSCDTKLSLENLSSDSRQVHDTKIVLAAAFTRFMAVGLRSTKKQLAPLVGERRAKTMTKMDRQEYTKGSQYV